MNLYFFHIFQDHLAAADLVVKEVLAAVMVVAAAEDAAVVEHQELPVS